MRTRSVALLTVAVLTACHRGSTDQSSYMHGISLSQPTPKSEATLAATYVALDAGKPGQPKLTAQELAGVQNVLHKTKPCQRPLLRYAFPGGDRKNGPIAMFFPIVQEGNGYSGSHVFGTSNVIYMWDGGVVSTMFTITDQQAIKMQKCASG